MAIFNNVPKDVQGLIFSYLPEKDINNLRRASKATRNNVDKARSSMFQEMKKKVEGLNKQISEIDSQLKGLDANLKVLVKGAKDKSGHKKRLEKLSGKGQADMLSLRLANDGFEAAAKALSAEYDRLSEIREHLAAERKDMLDWLDKKRSTFKGG